MREDELALRDATTQSAILRWGVVMEENSAMMLGGELPTDQVTDPKSACPTQREPIIEDRGVPQSHAETNRAHTQTVQWANIRPDSA